MSRRKKTDVVAGFDIGLTTLDEGKEWLKQRLSSVRVGRSVWCPCCNQKLAIRARLISAAQAALLVLLYRTFPIGAVVSINKFVDAMPFEESKEFLKSREWHRLRHWGVIELLEENDYIQAKEAYQSIFPGEDDYTQLWLYRLTQLGYDYAICDKPIPKRLLIFRNEVIGTDERETCTVTSSLKRGKFDFAKVFGEEIPAIGRVL